jgi:hypothetical protein
MANAAPLDIVRRSPFGVDSRPTTADARATRLERMPHFPNRLEDNPPRQGSLNTTSI